jgi:hypothetical protein
MLSSTALLLALCASPDSPPAPDATPSRGARAAEERLPILASGSEVKLKLREPVALSGLELEGVLTMPAADRWALRTRIDTLTFNPAAVQSLAVRRSWAGTGGTVGAVLGALAGGSLGFFVGIVGNASDPEPVRPMAIGALLGAALLGAAGAGVGYAIPDWQQLHPRPE